MKLIMCAATALVMSSCTQEPTPTPVTTTNDTYALVIGVENGYAGKCDGCLLDYKNMSVVIKPYAGKFVGMSDQQATRKNVVEAMKEGVKHELFIMYYSGHGGSTTTYTDKTETDGKDEFMCLYDQGLLDNDIWNILKESQGRVFLMFDCCHSATMFRTPVTFARQMRKLSASSNISGPINMICWSGCPDNTYSYGSSTGGQFTNTFRKYFNKDLTYDQLWSKIEANSTLKQYEIVQRTNMGKSFGSNKMFK